MASESDTQHVDAIHSATPTVVPQKEERYRSSKKSLQFWLVFREFRPPCLGVYMTYIYFPISRNLRICFPERIGTYERRNRSPHNRQRFGRR